MIRNTLETLGLSPFEPKKLVKRAIQGVGVAGIASGLTVGAVGAVDMAGVSLSPEQYGLSENGEDTHAFTPVDTHPKSFEALQERKRDFDQRHEPQLESDAEIIFAGMETAAIGGLIFLAGTAIKTE